jgi:hypothetical protein
MFGLFNAKQFQVIHNRSEGEIMMTEDVLELDSPSLRLQYLVWDAGKVQ